MAVTNRRVHRRPTHSGAVLREDVIIPLGLAMTEAARRLGASQKALSSEVAIRIGKATLAAWHLYIICTTDRKLYAGVTTDVQRRFKEHLSQGRRAARYLRAHKPKRLVFSQLIGDRSSALKAEYWFKRLPRERKERIIRSGRLRFDS